MAITWEVIQLAAAPEQEGLSQVVQTVKLRVCSEDNGAAGVLFATATLPAPDSTSFIPFTSLTEAQVLEWAWANGVDRQAYEDAANARMESSRPANVVATLPWAPPPSEPERGPMGRRPSAP